MKLFVSAFAALLITGSMFLQPVPSLFVLEFV
jgi:hypothetical protein